MDHSNNPFALLNLVEQPAFCVSDDNIVAVNQAATHYGLSAGMPVCPLLEGNESAYRSFTEGCLYLTLTVNTVPCGASIHRMDGFDLFIIENVDEALRALALAAQHLRIPLANVMTTSDSLFRQLEQEDNRTQAGHINRGLHQLLRIVSNMSDAAVYQGATSSPMELVNFTSMIRDLVEKANATAAGCGIKIQSSYPNEPILGLANPEQIQRAFHNLLSNAIKFSEGEKTVDVRLAKAEHMLSFSIRNSGIADESGDLFTHYRRIPGIESSLRGVGLGLTLVKAVAKQHGGTVLVDHPGGNDTRVTMTVALQKSASGAPVRSPILRIGDYAGGRDMCLLELSEVLTSDSYKDIN